MPLEDNALTTTDQIDLSVDTIEKERLINVASDMIENYCDRNFKKQTYNNEKYQPTGRQRLVLQNRPVISVDIITKNDTEVDSTSYFIENEKAGFVFKHDKWDQDYRLARSSISKNFQPGTNKYNIEVTYTAGYVLPKDATQEDPRTLPYDLEQAAILTVQYLNNAEDSDLRVQKESIADVSQTYFEQKMQNELPAEIINKIDRYADKI